MQFLSIWDLKNSITINKFLFRETFSIFPIYVVDITPLMFSTPETRLTNRKNPGTAPEPPPRNSILKPDIRAKSDSPRGFPDIRDKPETPEVEENLYSSAEFRENNFRREESLFDR